ncbi:MAG: hypothetical protein UY04_C0023G0014 [Parcubacteria group bacterium GW2011_GWA2_47_7]|nr:MAG: hypothetical protein UY04_C0023G0014 [Parcubacteria group bacterium GW2011_GWA2_47_7]
MNIKFLPLLLLAPLVVSAQSSSPISNTIVLIGDIAGQLIPLMMALAVLMFFWGILKFIANIGDEDARKAGKSMMVWGMIALFVMVSFWGIIGYVQESLGLQGVPVVTSEAPTFSNPTPGSTP